MCLKYRRTRPEHIETTRGSQTADLPELVNIQLKHLSDDVDSGFDSSWLAFAC